MTLSAAVPKVPELYWPMITALRKLGNSAAIEELDAEVLSSGGFTEEQQAVLHNDGPQTKIEYRLGWARTHLKLMGLLENSARGVWALSELGRSISEVDLEPLRKEMRRRIAGGSRAGASGDDDGDEVRSWQEELLDEVMKLDPAGFERLAQRVLREEGFINTRVTGRSGDGGIDGQGVYRMSLLSFQVFFQCKRYSGSVGSGAVRDFRGAMAGRGDKGLLITTGTFTSEAKAEATRDGAPPIDLIDGERLCDILKRHRLGVRVEERLVEDVTVKPDFFTNGF